MCTLLYSFHTAKFRKEFTTACLCRRVQPPGVRSQQTQYIYRYRYQASPGNTTALHRNTRTQGISHIDVTTRNINDAKSLRHKQLMNDVNSAVTSPPRDCELRHVSDARVNGTKQAPALKPEVNDLSTSTSGESSRNVQQHHF